MRIGFTVIELLIVVVILALLASVALLMLDVDTRPIRYKQLKDIERQLQQGIARYELVHGEKPPSLSAIIDDEFPLDSDKFVLLDKVKADTLPNYNAYLPLEHTSFSQYAPIYKEGIFGNFVYDKNKKTLKADIGTWTPTSTEGYVELGEYINSTADLE